MLGSLRDLTPILLVVAFFQLVVLQQPIPDLFNLVVGILLVILGLSFSSLGWNGPIPHRRIYGLRVCAEG